MDTDKVQKLVDALAEKQSDFAAKQEAFAAADLARQTSYAAMDAAENERNVARDALARALGLGR